MHLIKYNEIALKAAARAYEVGEAQQQRQRDSSPLSTAQLPGNAGHAVSNKHTPSDTVLLWSSRPYTMRYGSPYPSHSQRRA